MIKKKLLRKKLHVDLTLCIFIICLLLYGILVIWSASNQNVEITQHKIFQVMIGLLIMLFLAQIPPKIYEFLAPYIYFFSLLLLILVNSFGQINKGAQRWLDLGVIKFQPSEIIKISVLLITAYCINRAQQHPPSLKIIFTVFLLTLIPVVFISLQPDLGTAILTASAGFFVLFFSGITWKLIMVIFLLIFSFLPIFWYFFMHEYQRARIIMLWNPENDPLGVGYHIIQSKIAIGSGGLTGKGWLQGTQSQLEFVPERHTDFIFSVIGEELGLIGILILLTLYLNIIFRGFFIAIKIQHIFGKLITSGFMLVFFMYIFVNISMVSGILPIVGIPLPLISYGGSSLISLMSGFGIIMSMHSHRKLISKIL